MNNYPSDWEISQLSNFVDIKASSVDKKSRDDHDQVQLCNYMDVFNNATIDHSITFMKSTASKKEIKDFKLIKGDVLLTKDSEVPEEIGMPSVLNENIDNLICGYHLYLLRTKNSIFSPEYLCWTLRSNQSRQYFYQMANGSTRFGLNLRHVSKCLIPIPPLPEQKKIAEILSSIDELVKLIDKKIEKELFIFLSMQNELFNDLSNSDVKQGKLSDYLVDICGGGTPARDEVKFWNGAIPWASVKDLSSKKTNSTQESISTEGLNSSASRLIPAGIPILATRMAVGKTALFSISVAINQDLKAIFPNQSYLDKLFLFYFLGYKENELISVGTGSTVKGIRVEEIKNLAITLPSLTQQRKIAHMLSQKDNFIELLKRKKNYMSNLKMALNNDLLSGRKRVNV